ncbi:hypothetical protein RIF29_47718 [Crotalaria pallida]|uniref:Uncharacterized protein n=1 Tax=Crotalaria pallida TaxID=3830 RepID=A0AAN9DVL3_CROPI
MLRFPPVRSRVGLGEHPSDCLRGSKRAHKAHNKNKTNRDFIRDHLSCRSCGREVPGESMLSAETGLEAFEKPVCSFLPIEWRQPD